MEIKIKTKGWLIRDKDGSLKLIIGPRPFRDGVGKWVVNTLSFMSEPLDPSLYPEVTADDKEATEVRLGINKK